MKHLGILALVVILCLSIPLVSMAQCRRCYSPCYRSCYSRRYYRPSYYRCGYYGRCYDRGCYKANPATKLASGVSEVAFSWTEVPASIVDYSERCGPITGVVAGTVEGTALAARDCIEGAVNTALFWAPPYETRRDRYYGYGCRRRRRGLWETISGWDESFKENWW